MPIAPENVANMPPTGNNVIVADIEASKRPSVFHIRTTIKKNGSNASQSKLSTGSKATNRNADCLKLSMLICLLYTLDLQRLAVHKFTYIALMG